MNKVKRPKPTREELTGICKRVSELCKQYDAGIICEVTPLWPDYEESMRIEAEEGGYEFVGKPNLGFAYVFLTVPNDLGKKEHKLYHKISEFEDVAQVFTIHSTKKMRFKDSVRSDDPDLQK
jgi:hypothetical protein